MHLKVKELCGDATQESKQGTTIRQFKTGATRDTDGGKLHIVGYYSPLVMERFSQYMLRHETQSDGKMREPGNWKKGIPQDAYLDSLVRHVLDVWLEQETGSGSREGAEEALCGILFNAQGLLHERLKKKAP